MAHGRCDTARHVPTADELARAARLAGRKPCLNRAPNTTETSRRPPPGAPWASSVLHPPRRSEEPSPAAERWVQKRPIQDAAHRPRPQPPAADPEQAGAHGGTPVVRYGRLTRRSWRPRRSGISRRSPSSGTFASSAGVCRRSSPCRRSSRSRRSHPTTGLLASSWLTWGSWAHCCQRGFSGQVRAARAGWSAESNGRRQDAPKMR